MHHVSQPYDIIVVGAGHAGTEAAHAAAQMGMRVALVTLSRERIAEMPCNPAIGGLGKGHLVCEIDALGGLMGQAIDATGIQFRMLNRSKGPAVWGPRAQADKRHYREHVKHILESEPRIDLIEGQVTHIPADPNNVRGVTLADGTSLTASAVVVTTGTFLNGEIHIGSRRLPAGRIGEPAAVGLSESLRKLGLDIQRLKTGTCPRLDAHTVDYHQCGPQPGDNPPIPFSAETPCIEREQICCHITYTNETTHHILRNALDRAPVYSGQITAAGPRYCPSIEVKIVRFADKTRHQLFLEPEGLHTDWVYCGGLSTSIPEAVQRDMIHSIAGLQHAQIVQYGYAVEYDFVCPTQLWPTLEAKRAPRLFLAGQINGTSGYEEAAAQGLIAGINAARTIQNAEPIVLRRDQAYIGVMIDDLVTKGVDEPYRMFTSRAEFRLLLRPDTAERRLTPLAREIGTINDRRWQGYLTRTQQAKQLRNHLAQLTHAGVPAEAYLRRPQARWEDLAEKLAAEYVADLSDRVIRQVVTDCKYNGYEQRELRTVKKLRQLERVKLPSDLDFALIGGLRTECRERLQQFRPTTLGQASRVRGITPADILVLMVHLNGGK